MKGKGYVYILQCSDKSYYTGSTTNIEFRLWQHQNKQGSHYTQKRLPVSLVYCEEFSNIIFAYEREKQIQGWNRKKKQALIDNNFDGLKLLSKNSAKKL